MKGGRGQREMGENLWKKGEEKRVKEKNGKEEVKKRTNRKYNVS